MQKVPKEEEIYTKMETELHHLYFDLHRDADEKETKRRIEVSLKAVDKLINFSIQYRNYLLSLD